MRVCLSKNKRKSRRELDGARAKEPRELLWALSGGPGHKKDGAGPVPCWAPVGGGAEGLQQGDLSFLLLLFSSSQKRTDEVVSIPEARQCWLPRCRRSEHGSSTVPNAPPAVCAPGTPSSFLRRVFLRRRASACAPLPWTALQWAARRVPSATWEPRLCCSPSPLASVFWVTVRIGETVFQPCSAQGSAPGAAQPLPPGTVSRATCRAGHQPVHRGSFPGSSPGILGSQRPHPSPGRALDRVRVKGHPGSPGGQGGGKAVLRPLQVSSPPAGQCHFAPALLASRETKPPLTGNGGFPSV